MSLLVVVDGRPWPVKQQSIVFLPELGVVVADHALAVSLEVRELFQERSVRHPGKHFDQLVVREIQVSDVVAAEVSRVA